MSVSLYQFLKENTWEFTEEWYKGLDKTKGGVYGSTVPEKIQELKQQNHEFHLIFVELFNEESERLEDEFDQWVNKIVLDQAHLATPLPEIIEEFFNNQTLYLKTIDTYVKTHNPELSTTEYNKYIQLLLHSFQQIVIEFSKRNQEKSEQLLLAQKEMITELSSPVIHLNEQIALLPLVGEIDTHRAKVIFEQTLQSCVDDRIQSLLIDLSGVPVVDTMVANQLFQLIEGLTLVGTTASLSGIRPEIAQTAVQLGIDFNRTKVYATIASALSKLNFNAM
jgi:rsbT co-antagonist protein RsbR